MKFKLIVLEDGEYEAVSRTFESFDALKSAIKDIDTYGVGGYSTPNGVEFGTPTWTFKQGLRALLDESSDWDQLKEGLAGVFGKLTMATPTGVAIESDVDVDGYMVTFIDVEEG